MKYKLQRYWEILRHDLPSFFRSLWIFRKALWNYKWYGGHHGVFDFMSTAIEDMHTRIEERGIEEWISKGKKVEAMKRLVYLLDMFNKESFIEEAEKELGMQYIYRDFKFEPTEDNPELYLMISTTTKEEDAHNDIINKRARKIAKEGWKELIHLIQGQDYSKFSKKSEFLDQFDGSGIRGWWD
jgi:hypothetical protein